MTLENVCLLASKCKKAGIPEHCNEVCFPYLKMHGETGSGGILGLADIPSAYKSVLASSLPFGVQNPKAVAVIRAYCSNILDNVANRRGLYLYSIPNPQNPKGTGTGKTTATAAILNEYATARVIQHVKKEREIAGIPSLFVKASALQNAYNAQFRGPVEMQQEASRKFYNFKERMMLAELLAVDDIGLRDATPAFLNELYEIIDERSSRDGIATLFSSNTPLAEISRTLNDQIASRIDGLTVGVSFVGGDMRKGGAF